MQPQFCVGPRRATLQRSHLHHVRKRHRNAHWECISVRSGISHPERDRGLHAVRNGNEHQQRERLGLRAFHGERDTCCNAVGYGKRHAVANKFSVRHSNGR